MDDGTNQSNTHTTAGRRISETDNGVTTRYVVDPSSADYQTIEELNASGAMTANYTYGLERIDGVLPGGSSETFYLDDGLGSVGAITNSSGANVGNYLYDAFGQLLSSPTASTNPFGFAGERLDAATGLIDLRTRAYDPALGRFLAEDPSGFADGPNLFIYVSDEPINNVDPTGLSDTNGQWPTDSYSQTLHQLFPEVPVGPVKSPPIVHDPANDWGLVPPYFGGNLRGEGITIGMLSGTRPHQRKNSQ